MAGPVVAALGGFAFEAHGFGLTDLGQKLSTPWAAVKVAGGLDVLQWVGGDSDSIDIKGVLFPHVFGGLTAVAGLRAAAEAGTALPLVNLAGQIFGTYVIQAVNEDRSFIDAAGLPMRDAYSLSLKRYVGKTTTFVSVLEGLF